MAAYHECMGDTFGEGGASNSRPHRTDDLVVALLAASGCGLVRRPGWEFEHAVDLCSGHEDWAGRAASAAITPRPAGARVAELGHVLRRMLRAGLLVHSQPLNGYVVDTWALEVVARPLRPFPQSVLRAAYWLAQRDQTVRAASKNGSKS